MRDFNYSIVIPCRYGADRLPGKPIADINGKPLLWYVYQRAKKCRNAVKVVVATDDERIVSECNKYGIETIMTSSNHRTGTDRVAECAKFLETEIIVNVQGDEPFVEAEEIEKLAIGIANAPERVSAANGYYHIDSPGEVVSPNTVKVLFSSQKIAIAYSRYPIPYAKGREAKYYRQLGLYAFRKKALLEFASLPVGDLEDTESVELYRFLENERIVLMIELNQSGLAIDTMADLVKARTLLNPENYI